MGHNEIPISHLQSDDVIFFRKWSLTNLRNLFKILECFRLITGMRINMRKSKLFGVGIREDVIEDWARGAGCKRGKLPFTYLGIPVGASMRRVDM